jgi:hypothetical protein
VPDLYRIAHNNPARPEDFISQRGGGEPWPGDDAEDLMVALWVGVSVNATEVQARNKATDMPFLGRYIAHLIVPEGPTIPHAKTTNSRGHYTLWGTPVALHACVQSTVNV